MSNARSMEVRLPRVPPEEPLGLARPLGRLGRIRRGLTSPGSPSAQYASAQAPSAA
jgi:hypothetical protein